MAQASLMLPLGSLLPFFLGKDLKLERSGRNEPEGHHKDEAHQANAKANPLLGAVHQSLSQRGQMLDGLVVAEL